MATVTVSLPADGDTIDASDYNTPITTIVNELNGNLDSNNIKAGGVIATNLASNAVETAKIKDANVTAGKLASYAVETIKIKDANVTFGKLATGVVKSVLHGGTGNTACAAGVTQYVGNDSISSSTYLVPVPNSSTIGRLYVYLSSAPGSGKDYVCTVMRNNADTAITCTISGAATNLASDLTHSVDLDPSDRLCLKVVTTAGAATLSLTWCIEYIARV